MEPDDITPVLPPISRGNTSSGAASQIPMIRSFTQAVSALKSQKFPENTNDSDSVARLAIELHWRTREVINSADISNLQAARSTLHPINDYPAYIALLHASLATIEHDSPILSSLLSDYRDLVQHINPSRVRLVPERWLGVARHVVRHAIESFSPSQAISLVPVIRNAADKLCSQSDELVSIHADFLALCLHSKTYRLAASWLRKVRRLHVDPASGLQATDVHLYHHYSALVFIGVKDIPAALQATRLALSVPAPSPGSFFPALLHTYRLFIVLNLLQDGRSPPTLKHASHQASSFRKYVSEYTELTAAFNKMDSEQVRQIIETNRATFERQGMLGVINLLVDALVEKKVARLSKSFMAMDLTSLATRLGLEGEDAAHALLFELTEEGKVNASIDERRKIVQLFLEEVSSETDFAARVSADCLSQCLEVISRLQRFGEELERDPAFIMKELEAEKNRLQVSSNAGAPGTPGRHLADIESEHIR